MNYAELSQMIQDACANAETTFVTHIPDFVHAAEQRIYQAVQIPALRKHSSLSTVAGNRYVDTPNDYLAAFAAAIVISGVYTEMQYRDVDWLRAAYPDPTATGTPQYYGLYGYDKFVLSKTPATIATMELHYYYKPTSIVSASTSWLGDNFDSVLFWGAMVQAYIYMKGDADMLTHYDNQFKTGLLVLKETGDGASKERKV